MRIPGEDMRSQLGCAFPVRMYIPSESHPYSRVRHTLIPSEDESHRNKHPKEEWRCDSPGMHILTGNGAVPHQECRPSLGMGM